MNGILTLDNLNIILLPQLNYSSDSSVEASDKIIEQEKIIADKFLLLKKDIGAQLFNRLTYEQKVFIINVSNTINLGGFVDIDEIYNDIENLEHE